MARMLLLAGRMKAFGFALAFLALIAVPLRAQEVEPPDGTRISSAQMTGIDPDRVGQAIKDDIGKLVGAPLNRAQLRQIADRIEAEQPRTVTAVRLTPDSS